MSTPRWGFAGGDAADVGGGCDAIISIRFIVLAGVIRVVFAAIADTIGPVDPRLAVDPVSGGGGC